MQSVAGNQDHSRRSVSVPQYRQTGDQGFGKIRPYTKRAALPENGSATSNRYYLL